MISPKFIKTPLSFLYKIKCSLYLCNCNLFILDNFYSIRYNISESKKGKTMNNQHIQWKLYDDLLGKQTDRSIAEIIGCEPVIIWRRRKKLNIKRFQKIDYVKNPHPKFKYIQDKLIQHNMLIKDFATLIDIDRIAIRKWISHGVDPHFQSIQLICRGLEKITGETKEIHSNAILWGVK